MLITPAAQKIKERRKERGWCQELLAYMAGTSDAGISGIETGRLRLTESMSARLNAALDREIPENDKRCARFLNNDRQTKSRGRAVEIYNLRNQGYSYKEISNRYNVTAARVRQIYLQGQVYALKDQIAELKAKIGDV